MRSTLPTADQKKSRRWTEAESTIQTAGESSWTASLGPLLSVNGDENIPSGFVQHATSTIHVNDGTFIPRIEQGKFIGTHRLKYLHPKHGCTVVMRCPR